MGKDVQKTGTELELKKDTLPGNAMIYVLDPSK
jgi:hypothetical protein